MPYCTSCGTELDPEASFCTNCGAAMEPGARAGDASKARDGEASRDRAGDDGPGARSGADRGRSATSDARDARSPRTDPADGVASESAVEHTAADDEWGTGPTDAIETDAEPEGPGTSETRGRQLSAVGALMAAIGSFLPWLEAEFLGQTETLTGIDGDGMFTLGAAIVVGILLLAGRGKRWSVPARVAVLVLGVIALLVPAIYINDPAAGTEEWRPFAEAVLEPAYGLYVTAIGGGLIAIGPIWGSFGRE